MIMFLTTCSEARRPAEDWIGTHGPCWVKASSSWSRLSDHDEDEDDYDDDDNVDADLQSMCACVELTKTAVPSEMGGGVAQPCIKKHIIFIILKIDPFFRLGLPIPG